MDYKKNQPNAIQPQPNQVPSIPVYTVSNYIPVCFIFRFLRRPPPFRTYSIIALGVWFITVSPVPLPASLRIPFFLFDFRFCWDWALSPLARTTPYALAAPDAKTLDPNSTLLRGPCRGHLPVARFSRFSLNCEIKSTDTLLFGKYSWRNWVLGWPREKPQSEQSTWE